MCTSLRDADKHRISEALDDYVDLLKSNGVGDFESEEATFVLRFGSISAFAARLFPLGPALDADPQAPLTVMRHVGFRRVSDAIERLESIEVMRDIVGG